MSLVSSASAVHGSSSVERRRRSLESRLVELGRIGLDVAEEEAREVGELPEAADLLLDERCRVVDALGRPVETLLADEEHEPVGVLPRLERAQVDAVQPVELRVVERAGARADRLEAEPLDDLVARHDRRLAVGRPADQGEEVDERLGEVARGAELVHRERAVPLRELLAVVAEEAAEVRVGGRLVAERLQDLDLLRRVRDVVVAADHVGDRVVHVLDGGREVVGRPAVGADDDDVLELDVRHLDATADDVVPAGRALVGHPEADRAVVLVRPVLGHEPGRELAAAIHRVELERDGAVPVDPEPRERPLDLRDGLGDLAARVGVLDPEQALAAAAAREEPVEEEGVHAADVEEPGRGRRHADADGHRCAIVVGVRGLLASPAPCPSGTC